VHTDIFMYVCMYVCMFVGVYADGSASSVTYLLDKVRKNKRQRGEFEYSVYVRMYVYMYVCGVCMYVLQVIRASMATT